MTIRLPRTGRHLEGDAVDVLVRSLVDIAERVLDPGVAVPGRDLGDVDRRLERFDLTEEQAPLAIGLGPVLEQFASCPGDPGVTTRTPDRDPRAHLVDELVRP